MLNAGAIGFLSKPYRNEKLTKFLVAIAGSSRSVSRTISAMFVELLWVPYRSNGGRAQGSFALGNRGMSTTGGS